MRAGWVAAAVLIAAGVGAYFYVKSGKAPPLAKTLQAVASSAEALASQYVPSDSPPDAGADADAGEVLRRQNGPLSNVQLGAPLVHGTFVSECGAPDTMHVTVKVGVKFGRATNVDVKTTPPDSKIASCIERSVRDKQWDVSPKPGRVTVKY
jgi:hypothetical protein